MKDEILLQMITELADKAWGNDINGRENWLDKFDIYFDEDSLEWKFK